MKIHVIGSLREFEDDIPYIQAILRSIEKNDALLALNWIDAVIDRRKRQTTHHESLFDWEELVDTNVRILKEVDALIVEGSHFNYSQGFQTAIALQNNKPVLNLYREDLPEYKEWPDKLFVSGISHPLFTNQAYRDETELEEIVATFIKEHSKRAKELDLRLALNTDDYNKIDQLSHDQGKSKTSIVKDLLLKNLHDK
jgi:hypothetical protein